MLNKLGNIFLSDTISSKQKLIHLILLSLSVILVYSNIFNNNFILDDRDIFFRWKEVKELNIPALLKGAYPQTIVGITTAYRPIKAIIHAVEYNLTANNIAFYHLQAILLQIAITLTIYFITLRLTKKTNIAFLTSLIFAVHPVHTEAITFITASFDSIGLLLYFLSLYCYISWREKVNKKYYVGSLVLGLLAFFTYELTFSLPIVFVLYDICFGHFKKSNLIKNAIAYIPYFIGVISYFILKRIFLPHLESLSYFANSFNVSVITMFKAFLIYYRLLLFPFDVSFDQILPGNIPIISGPPQLLLELLKNQTFLDIYVISSFLVIIISFILFFKNYKKYPILAFCLGFFYLAFAPVSGILPTGEILAVRWTYISSFPFALVLAYLIFLLKDLKLVKRNLYLGYFIFILIASYLIFLTMVSIYRNKDYKDQITMAKTLTKQNITINKADYYLGKYYFYQNDYNTSIKYFKKLSQHKQLYEYADVYYYLTIDSLKLNDITQAKIYYIKLLKALPNYDRDSLKLLSNQLKNNSKKQINIDNSNPDFFIYNNPDYTFQYPKTWKINEKDNLIKLYYPKSNFSITINYTILYGSESIQDYILNKAATVKLGTLKQQGKANIPSVEYSYVKIWDDNDTPKVQFFLFKGKNVLEIIASPFTPENTESLNLILNSIKFAN